MATLKSLVDETTNIKNELVECYGNLKNNLIKNDIDISGTERLSDLISKIDKLRPIDIWVYNKGLSKLNNITFDCKGDREIIVKEDHVWFYNPKTSGFDAYANFDFSDIANSKDLSVFNIMMVDVEIIEKNSTFKNVYIKCYNNDIMVGSTLDFTVNNGPQTLRVEMNNPINKVGIGNGCYEMKVNKIWFV